MLLERTAESHVTAMTYAIPKVLKCGGKVLKVYPTRKNIVYRRSRVFGWEMLGMGLISPSPTPTKNVSPV